MMKLCFLLCGSALLGMFSNGLDVSQIFDLDENDKKDLCIDLVFVLDWSCSVALKDFNKMRNFVRKMVLGMKIGPTKSQVGLVTFSEGAKKWIGVEDFSDKDRLIEKIDDIFAPCQHINEVNKREELSACCEYSTETWRGLELVRTDKDLLKQPRRNSEGKERTRVVVIVTDGVPRKRTTEINERGQRKSGDSTTLNRIVATNMTIEEGRTYKEENIISIVVKVPNKNGKQSQQADVFKELATDYSDDDVIKYLLEIDDLQEDVGEVFRIVARYTCPDYCDEELDIVFIMDKSISISAHNVELVKKFFKKILESFNLEKIHVGMLTYNEGYKLVFKLNRYNLYQVESEVEDITTTTNKYTQTHIALKRARDMLAKYGRPNIPKLAVLACDGITWLKGKPNEFTYYYPVERSPSHRESDMWKRKGYDIIIIGEPNHNAKRGYPEWELVATKSPEGSVDQHIYDMQNMDKPVSFSDILSITGNLTRTICKLAA